MARRLMALQRQQMAEGQVLDRRARRVLHDDVLPHLHTAMLSLSTREADRDGSSSNVIALLGDVHRQLSDLLHEMPATTIPEIGRLGLVSALRHTVDEELANAFDSVTWEVDSDAGQEMQELPLLTAEVLFYAAREAIRNAARYGRAGDAAQPLHLRVKAASLDSSAETGSSGLEVVIEDDGAGLEAGQGSSEVGGHGLALHSTMMAVVGGSLTIESVPDAYTRVSLRLPQTTWK